MTTPSSSRAPSQNTEPSIAWLSARLMMLSTLLGGVPAYVMTVPAEDPVLNAILAFSGCLAYVAVSGVWMPPINLRAAIHNPDMDHDIAESVLGPTANLSLSPHRSFEMGVAEARHHWHLTMLLVYLLMLPGRWMAFAVRDLIQMFRS